MGRTWLKLFCWGLNPEKRKALCFVFFLLCMSLLTLSCVFSAKSIIGRLHQSVNTVDRLKIINKNV